jgi:hypothetical protein
MGLGMGKGMVREHVVSILVVVIACLDAALAHASPPSDSALESQAQAEFAKVGTAVRERLDREAAGDLIGARIAAQDAEAHRYRYLDIKRAVNRQRSASLASSSVEAPRNPFLPDASFLAPASPTRLAPRMIGRQEAIVGAQYPAWDMYRPHEVRALAGTQGADQYPEARSTTAEVPMAGPRDMYSNGVAKPTAGDGAAVATDPSASAFPAEPAREPFLVYREGLDRSDSR